MKALHVTAQAKYPAVSSLWVEGKAEGSSPPKEAPDVAASISTPSLPSTCLSKSRIRSAGELTKTWMRRQRERARDKARRSLISVGDGHRREAGRRGGEENRVGVELGQASDARHHESGRTLLGTPPAHLSPHGRPPPLAAELCLGGVLASLCRQQL